MAIAVIVSAMAPVSALAATYYVSLTGDDNNPGSSALPKRQIQAAVDIPDATEIIVGDGTYDRIATNNKAVTIRSVNGAAVTIIDGGNTNRCATLGSADGHTNTVLTGFMLRNGYTSGFGGGSYHGTLNDCTLSGNMASDGGGGSYYGTLNDCTLSGNTAIYDGGGSYGGTLNNCTLSGNSADDNGGGSYQSALNDCIVWGNLITDTATTNNHYNSAFRYSCTSPLPSGSYNVGGNVVSDPMFVDAANGNFQLRSGSPCIDAGANSYVVGTADLAGNPRIVGGTVDMGAYEWMPPAFGEAVNAPALAWQSGGDAPWFVQTVTTHDGDRAAQSGVVGKGQASWIETTVSGSGALSFWWKVSSEAGYDWLTCTTNGVLAMRISGEVGWEEQVLAFADGETVVRWTFAKFPKDKVGNDFIASNCGWLDCVAWVPSGGKTQGTPVPVPFAWLDLWQSPIADYEDFAAKPGANGIPRWESYVAGLDPTNGASHFAITNVAVDAADGVSLGWAPDYETALEPWTGKRRVYVVEGKTNLTDGAWHSPTNDASRFFRVKVRMPE